MMNLMRRDLIGPGMPTVRRALLPLLTLMAVLGVWQILTAPYASRFQPIPPPLDILRSISANAPRLLTDDIPITVEETVIGLLTALAFGLLIAAILDYSDPLKRAVYPLLVTSQTIPVVAMAPVL